MIKNDLHKLGSAFLLSTLLFLSGCGTTDETGNILPVADAGDDITVIQNELFTFDASKSYDLDGNITSYEWFCADFNITLYKGPNNTLTMPAQRPIGDYNTTLIITDDKNVTTKDYVIVKIIAPIFVANAGDDITVIQNELFTFDGSKSYNLDGNIINYEWFCSDFNITLYSGPNSNLTMPAQRPVGSYNTKLIITNEKNETTEDYVIVTITESDTVVDDDVIDDGNTSDDDQNIDDTMDLGITINQFKTLQQQGVVYIDIRSSSEQSSTGIIEGSEIILNPSDINTWLQNDSEFLNLVIDKDQSFILVCASGGRAYVTSNALKDIGYTNAHYLIGGIGGWINANEDLIPVN